VNTSDLTSLRQLADHLVSLQQRLTDGLDELQRRLAAFEDDAVAVEDKQARIRFLSEQRRSS
jgi:hypothetical protein